VASLARRIVHALSEESILERRGRKNVSELARGYHVATSRANPVFIFCEDDIVKSSAGPKFAMYFTVTPVSQLPSIAWTYVAKDYENIPDEETQRFEDMITLQDVPIVESQRPELLSLDLQAELHLRSDRTAIAYRKWLRELGLTFGTA
jgi:phenylpropionate dioxygenase-like ring-hydroxylating dioxygenase large terminal subunit